LDPMDRKILQTILEKFGGGPVGVETIAASVGEQRDTLEDVYEPYLLQEGVLQRTPRGRIATQRTYRYFGKAPPENTQVSLWERYSQRRFGGRVEALGKSFAASPCLLYGGARVHALGTYCQTNRAARRSMDTSDMHVAFPKLFRALRCAAQRPTRGDHYFSKQF